MSYTNPTEEIAAGISSIKHTLANATSSAVNTHTIKNIQNDEVWLQIFCALISGSSAGAKMAMPSYAKLADQALEEFTNRYPF